MFEIRYPSQDRVACLVLLLKYEFDETDKEKIITD